MKYFKDILSDNYEDSTFINFYKCDAQSNKEDKLKMVSL